MRTKRALPARIRRVPTSVVVEHPIAADTQAMTFRITPSDDDANRGVRLSLSSARRYTVDDYSPAHAFIGTERIALTRKRMRSRRSPRER